jgi:uncharacterized protein YwqG
MTSYDPSAQQAAARPALHLVATEATGGFTRLGGRPSLPPGVAWPRWNGVPLAFLAQIDLAETPRDAPRQGLPDSGCLWFFYVADQSTWGFDPADAGSWQVVYATQRPRDEPASPPTDLPEDALIGEVRLTFRRIDTLPSAERAGVDIEPFEEDDFEALDAATAAPFEGRPRHQMGGYPGPQQGDAMELECQLVSHGLYCGDASGYEDPRAAALSGDAGSWQLLLQLDSDDAAGVMWGDCGRLYFWIHADDLARRDFSRVWMVLQCG